jgi:hypothetical protein
MAEELGTYVPGEAHLFSQPIEMRFNEILEGTRADIAVKIFGDDFAMIEKIAGEAREILEKIPGAADVEFDALREGALIGNCPETGGDEQIQSPCRRAEPGCEYGARGRGSRQAYSKEIGVSTLW